MIEKLLEASNGRLLVPLIVVLAGVPIVRGAFSLAQSRNQSRRDFLELFKGHESQSDFWTVVAIRHLFGAYLPIATIRSLMVHPQSGTALLEVAQARSFFDVDDKSGKARWRRNIFAKAWKRRVAWVLLHVAYLVLASISIGIALECMKGELAGLGLVTAWFYTGLLFAGAIFALGYAGDLRDAHRALPRWLGIR